jgi:hypothetical protein
MVRPTRQSRRITHEVLSRQRRIDGAPYTATLGEAKRIARNAAANSYHDVVVEPVEVATDKENVLRLLNNAAGTHIKQGVAYTAN